MDAEREGKTEELWHPDIRMNPQVLLSLIKSSPLGIVALDINGTIRIWNKAAEGLSGWREEEVLGQSIRVLFGDGWEPYEGASQAHIAQGSIQLDANLLYQERRFNHTNQLLNCAGA